MKRGAGRVNFDSMKSAIDPWVIVGLRKVPLPVACIPRWTPEMGIRLVRWRKHTCPRVDKRTRDYAHYREADGPQCTCLDQIRFSKALKISQSFLSKLETGKVKSAPSIGLFLSAFGGDFGAVLYVLTGQMKERFERKISSHFNVWKD